MCTRLDAARWARLSRRAGHRATGPQGQRVAAGMAKVTHWHLLRSSVQGRGEADLQYSPNGRVQLTRSEID